MSMDKLSIIVVNYSGGMMTILVPSCLLTVSDSCLVTELNMSHHSLDPALETQWENI